MLYKYVSLFKTWDIISEWSLGKCWPVWWSFNTVVGILEARWRWKVLVGDMTFVKSQNWDESGVSGRVRWRAPVIQVTGRLRLEDGLSSGALNCSGLCGSGVGTKLGMDMVLLGELGTTRWSEEGCTGPGRKRSRSKPPCRSVVGWRLWIDAVVQPERYSGTQSFYTLHTLQQTAVTASCSRKKPQKAMLLSLAHTASIWRRGALTINRTNQCSTTDTHHYNTKTSLYCVITILLYTIRQVFTVVEEVSKVLSSGLIHSSHNTITHSTEGFGVRNVHYNWHQNT